MDNLLKNQFSLEFLNVPNQIRTFILTHERPLQKISSILGDKFPIPEDYKLGDLRKELEHVCVGNKTTWKIFSVSLADISAEEMATCSPHIKKLVQEVKLISVDALFKLIPKDYINIIMTQKPDLYANIKEIIDDLITLTLNHHRSMDDRYEFIRAVVNDIKSEELCKKCESLLSFNKTTLFNKGVVLLPQIIPLLSQICKTT